MQNFSTTQATNIAGIVGILVIILGHFNIDIKAEELTTLIGATMTFIGIVANFIHRYQKGGVTPLGKYK